MNKQVLKHMAKILVEVAKAGPGNLITYGDLSQKIDNCISPRNLNHPLGTLSEIALENGFPRISAIVVNQETLMPGEGFFNYFANGIAESEWESFWKEDIEKIYNCTNWDEYLKVI